MMGKKNKAVEEVMGWRIAPARPTLWAWYVVSKYIGLPIFAGLALLDVIFYMFFQHVLDRCYGILCLVGS